MTATIREGVLNIFQELEEALGLYCVAFHNQLTLCANIA